MSDSLIPSFVLSDVESLVFLSKSLIRSFFRKKPMSEFPALLSIHCDKSLVNFWATLRSAAGTKWYITEDFKI